MDLEECIGVCQVQLQRHGRAGWFWGTVSREAGRQLDETGDQIIKDEGSLSPSESAPFLVGNGELLEI